MTTTKRIIFFGDSITREAGLPQGYISLLQQTCLQGWEVINAGVDGDNIDDLLARVEQDVFPLLPATIVLNIGINDSAPYEGKPLLSLPYFLEKYHALIAALQRGGATLLLCTPTIVGENLNHPDLDDENVEKFAQAIRDLAQQYHLPVADLRAAFVAARAAHGLSEGEFGHLTHDGVHLTPTGQALAAVTLEPILGKLLVG